MASQVGLATIVTSIRFKGSMRQVPNQLATSAASSSAPQVALLGCSKGMREAGTTSEITGIVP